MKLKLFMTFVALSLALGWIFRGAIEWRLEQLMQEDSPPAFTREEVFELQQETMQGAATSTPAYDETQEFVDEYEVKEPANTEIKPTPTIEVFNLKIPFTPQAPHANWDMPYQEACEEASVLMAHWFIEGTEDKTKEEVDQDILELVAWETERFGYYEDTTVEETLAMLHEKFGYTDAYSVEDPTIQDIEEAIVNGYPVIAPAAGKLLNNPYFSGDGPLYHMLVIRGFTDTHFITNDPGTRRGEEFQYEKKHLMSVIHDWNNGDVENGRQAIIVVKY